MDKKTVAVLFGGCSSEYEVSLQSAYSIIGSINRDKYEIVLIGITRGGEWRRFNGDIERLLDDTWYDDTLPAAIISPSRPGRLIELGDTVTYTPVDVLFPVLHGRNGEDGTVQGLGELAGIPVVGSGSAASALCMDKHRAHRLVSLYGVRVPEAVSFEKQSGASAFGLIGHSDDYPLFVKPVKAGSSLGITKVYSEAELMPAIEAAFMFDNAVIVEEAIEGFEVGCAVVGNEVLTTGRPDEIELSGGFFDFMEKYTLKTSKIHMPARVDAEAERRITETAEIIYRALGCKGYARVDMFLTPDGELVFNEVNTIPGFTSHSRFPNMMKGVGVEFDELVDRLISLALEDRQ